MEMVRDLGRPFECVETIEIGCGLGKFSLGANMLGCRTTLIDYNPSTVEVTNALFRHFGRVGDIRVEDALNLPENLRGSFDFAMSFGTAEHFLGAERVEIFRAHASVLKPGGRTFIAVPNALCFPYRIAHWLRLRMGLWPEQPPEIAFTRKELLGLGTEAGLKNCRVVPCTFFHDDVRYWVGENIKSLLRKLTGHPRRIEPEEFTTPPLAEMVEALASARPLATSFLDRHFAYSIALVGTKLACVP